MSEQWMGIRDEFSLAQGGMRFARNGVMRKIGWVQALAVLSACNGTPTMENPDAEGDGSAPMIDASIAPGDAGLPPSDRCAPFPEAEGETLVVTPDQADDLPDIVEAAASGTTILLEDGVYRMTTSGESARRIHFVNPGITLRSASDDASRVTIDGEYETAEILFVAAADTTIAHITITRAVDHAIHIAPLPGGTTFANPVLYGLRLIDNGEQFVKVNSNGTGFVDDGLLACSYFELTDDGRPEIERDPGGCYTGGIDAHGAQGWTVRDNRFESIFCAGEGLAEHAIHFWSQSRDTIVERNVIIDCARGIGFGLGADGATRPYEDDPYPGVGYIGHYDGIVRNNVIFANNDYFDTGIELAQARGSRVYHNTIFSTGGASFFSSIDYRFENTDVDVRNNLVERITARDGGVATLANNFEDAAVDYFVDVASLDFHLSANAVEAIDRGVVVAEAGLDIDGETHDSGAAPDIGADEVVP